MSSSELIAELLERVARIEESLHGLVEQLDQLKEIRNRVMHGRPGSTKSHFLRVAEFLIARKNQPQTTSRILKATGITRNALSQVLHVTHKDMFISQPIPDYVRKKKWTLSDQGLVIAAMQLEEWKNNQRTLFDPPSDMIGLSGKDCCAKILSDHGNEPMGPLALAKEALSRGYRGNATGAEDEVLFTTAKSFWADLGRDPRFVKARPMAFKLHDRFAIGGKENDPAGR